MTKSENFLIACKVPTNNQNNSNKEVEYLFKSLNIFGGNLAKSKKIACFNETPDSSLVDILDELGVSTLRIDGVDEKCPNANKIQVLSLGFKENFDFLIVLDTDIVVSRDFSSLIQKNGLGAKPVDGDPLSMEQWKKLFEFFGVELPKERYLTSFNMTETIPYFNSGVLFISKNWVSILYEAWISFYRKLSKFYQKFPDIEKHSFFSDQFALSLAIAEKNVPHYSLPLEMNFPTHIKVHEGMEPAKLDPYLIHYHHSFSSNGKISHCSYANINLLIDKINKEIIR